MPDTPVKRDEWDIKEDLRAMKRTIKIIKDPERLKDVQELIKANKDITDSLDAIADGDLKKALGVDA